MILLHTENFYFAFNWNPVVKCKRLFSYRKCDDYVMLDAWKFRTIKFKEETQPKQNSGMQS